MKKQTKNILIVLGIIVLIVALVFVLGGERQSVSLSPNFPTNVEKTEVWNTINTNILLKSFYFGSAGYATSSGGMGCSGSGPSQTLTNSYSILDSIQLSSYIKSQDGICSGNYIYTEFVAPKGELDINYQISITKLRYQTPEGQGSSINVYVDGKKVFTDHVTISGWRDNPPAGTTNSKNDIFKLNINESQKVKVELLTGTHYDSSNSASATIHFEKQIAPTPPTPPPPESKGILASIRTWLSRVFDAWSSLFIRQQIFGEEVVQPGSLQTYNISLTTTKPDSDFSDGKYQVQFANWILVDKNENIIREGQWEEIDGEYTTQAIFIIPQNIENHLLIAMIVQYDMEYDFNTKQWVTVSEEVVKNEAFGIKTSIPQPVKPTPQIGTFFRDIINNIIDFFRNLFR